MKKSVFLTCILLFVVGGIAFCQQSIKVTEISKEEKYGFSEKLAIKVGTVENEYAYLKLLQGPNGEEISYSRISSCCEFKCKTAAFGTGFLDKWKITYEGLEKPLIIFLNGYEYEDPKCPQGLSIKAFENLQTIPTEEGEKLVVTPCNPEQLFAVDDFLLREKLDEDLPQASKNPAFEGGEKALKTYFKANPLQDETAKNQVFRVAIAFTVNCEGLAGNFQIVTQGKGQLEEYAKQVMDIVSKMPQKWKAAEHNGKTVDSYQVLSFTVSNCKLESVSYYE